MASKYTLLFTLGLSLCWHGPPEFSGRSPHLSSFVSHLINTASTSHGSSLTTRPLGDEGRFLAASDAPDASDEREAQVWSRPILLGDEGRADSWLWEETCDGGLAKRPTVEREYINCIYWRRVDGRLCFWSRDPPIDWWAQLHLFSSQLSILVSALKTISSLCHSST